MSEQSRFFISFAGTKPSPTRAKSLGGAKRAIASRFADAINMRNVGRWRGA